ncbi:MAG: hypothetical protein KJ000_19180 [Pirellulaceae bacterium]|nr:hypothetical protein [Pirellulaceae bacterium]
MYCLASRAAPWLAVCLLGWSSELSAEESAFRRWAIVGDNAMQQVGLTDLVFLNLSEAGIDLVEREQVGRALQELQLSALSGDAAVGSQLKLGRLLGADVLLLLNVEPEGEGPAVRVIAVEARLGARLQSQTIATGETRQQETADEIGRFVQQVRTRFPKGVQALIGLAPFTPRSFSREWDGLQTGFFELIQAGLSRTPGVAVLEIEQAREILKEREIVDGAPEQRQLPIFVEGEYTVSDPRREETPQLGSATAPSDESQDRTGWKDNPHVNLTVRIHRAGQPPRESTGRDIPLDRLSQRLANEVPAAILKFATGAGHTPLSSEQQADLFRDQAERCADLGLWLSAAQLYEAASLVAPEDLETRLAAFHCYYRAIHARRPSYVRAQQWKAEDPEGLAREGQRRLAWWEAGARHVRYAILSRKLSLPEAHYLLVYAYTDDTVFDSIYFVDAHVFRAARSRLFWDVAPVFAHLDPTRRDAKQMAAVVDYQKRGGAADGGQYASRRIGGPVGWVADMYGCLERDLDMRPVFNPSVSDAHRGKLTPQRAQQLLDAQYRLLRDVIPRDDPWQSNVPTREFSAQVALFFRRGVLDRKQVEQHCRRLADLDSVAARNVSQRLKERLDDPRALDALWQTPGRPQWGQPIKPGPPAKPSGSPVPELKVVRPTHRDWYRELVPPQQTPVKHVELDSLFQNFTFERIASVEWPDQPQNFARLSDSYDWVLTSGDQVWAMSDWGNLTTLLTEQQTAGQPIADIRYDAASDLYWVVAEATGVFVTTADGTVHAHFARERELPMYDVRSPLFDQFGKRQLQEPHVRLFYLEPGRFLAWGEHEQRSWLALLEYRDGQPRADVLLQAMRPWQGSRQDHGLDLGFRIAHLSWGENAGRPVICITRDAFGQDRPHRVAPLLVDVAAKSVSVGGQDMKSLFPSSYFRDNVLGRSGNASSQRWIQESDATRVLREPRLENRGWQEIMLQSCSDGHGSYVVHHDGRLLVQSPDDICLWTPNSRRPDDWTRQVLYTLPRFRPAAALSHLCLSRAEETIWLQCREDAYWLFFKGDTYEVDLTVPQCRRILGNGRHLRAFGPISRTFFTPRHGRFFLADGDVFRVRADAAEPSAEHLVEIRRRAGLQDTEGSESLWWQYLQTTHKLNGQGIRCRWVGPVYQGFQEVLITEDFGGDAGALAAIPESPPVRQLAANDCALTDACLAQIANHTELQWLHLAGTQVTAAGLEHLERLQQLQELHLIGDQFDDAALLRLPPLKNLRILVISGKGITPDGLQHWQEQSPVTRAIHWYVDK